MSHTKGRRVSPNGRKERRSPLKKRYVLPSLPPKVAGNMKRRKLLRVNQPSSNDYGTICKKGRSNVDVISLDNITSVTNMLRNLESNASGNGLNLSSSPKNQNSNRGDFLLKKALSNEEQRRKC